MKAPFAREGDFEKTARLQLRGCGGSSHTSALRSVAICIFIVGLVNKAFTLCLLFCFATSPGIIFYTMNDTLYTAYFAFPIISCIVPHTVYEIPYIGY